MEALSRKGTVQQLQIQLKFAVEALQELYFERACGTRIPFQYTHTFLKDSHMHMLVKKNLYRFC